MALSPKSFLRRQAANGLTLMRLALSVALLCAAPLTTVYFALYALCGLTDMTDGAVARHFGSASRFGALLDSTADMVFVAAAAITLLPAFFRRLSGWWWLPVAVIVLIKLLTFVTGCIKFRKPCFLHTYLNKFAGAVVFLLPFFCGTRWFPAAVGIVCTVALAAAADEFLRFEDNKIRCGW